MRFGIGFDAHRFEEGRRLVLGGVEVPHGRGLGGHSDADVVLHAVMDAMLGACGAGDIGEMFPDSDPSYRGVSSLALLKEVVAVVSGRGYRLVNVDVVVVCEEPRIRPYREGMRESMGRALGLEAGSISVKGTTTEGMGFTGRGEGIACLAAVLLDGA